MKNVCYIYWGDSPDFEGSPDMQLDSRTNLTAGVEHYPALYPAVMVINRNISRYISKYKLNTPPNTQQGIRETYVLHAPERWQWTNFWKSSY